MKKVFALLAATTVIILLGSPKVAGLLLASSEPEARLQELTGQPGLRLDIVSGWFGSQGQVRVSAPKIAGVTYDGIVLVADVELAHGPLLATDTGLRPGIAWARLTPVLTGLAVDHPLQQLFADAAGSHITVFAGLNGSMRLELQADAPSFVLPTVPGYPLEPTTVTLADLQASLALAANGMADLQINSTAMRVHSAVYDAIATQPTLQAHSTQLSDTPLPGTLRLAAQELRIDGLPALTPTLSLGTSPASAAATATSSLTMQGISIDYAARQQPDTNTITLQQTLGVTRIESALPLESLTLSTQLSGIDAALATEYITFLRETQGVMQAMTAPQLQAHIAEYSETLALHLLQSPLQQNSTLNVRAWSGDHQATVDMQWPGIPSLSSLEQIDTATMVQMLGVTLEIAADAQTVASGVLAVAAKTYTTQGMLTEENDKIVLRATMQDGSVHVNGTSFPLGPLLNF
jgi:hypothetical protein